MQAPERTVLHVLPHPGGGGETYVDLLDAMPGYRFSRIYLASSSRSSAVELARGVSNALRMARRHDIVHVQGEPAAGLCIPLLVARPSVVTFNGLHLVRRVSGFRHRAAVLNLRTILRATDYAICVCNAERDHLTAAVGPASARRSVVIHNGVRIPPSMSQAERRVVRDERGLSESEPVAIWVGSLDERKDPLLAIRAANQAATPLIVVGDGPLRREVELAAGPRTHVLGQRDDVPRLLAAADIFLLTSHREGFAFSLLEAMAHGLVSVVMDRPENTEAIGDTGVGVQSGDDSVATALRRLAADADERADRGARALHRVIRLFSATDMERRTRAIYDDALEIGRDAPS